MPVKQLKERCWVLGVDDDRDFDPHFGSEDKARSYARDSEPAALPTIKALDEPCWIAVCDGPGGGPFGVCDEEFEDDEGGGHGPSEAVTVEWITAYQWKIAADGRAFGSCCTDSCPAGAVAAAPVVAQIPGQLTLDGQKVAG